jgi:hypothetical protein
VSTTAAPTTTTVARAVPEESSTTVAVNGPATTVAPASVATAGANPTVILSAPSGTGGVATIVAFTAPATVRLLKVGKSTTFKSLATYLKLVVPTGAKLSARVTSSSSKICRISGSSVKALKKGTCAFSMTVKPKKGKTKSKSGKLLVK